MKSENPLALWKIGDEDIKTWIGLTDAGHEFVWKWVRPWLSFSIVIYWSPVVNQRDHRFTLVRLFVVHPSQIIFETV